MILLCGHPRTGILWLSSVLGHVLSCDLRVVQRSAKNVAEKVSHDDFLSMTQAAQLVHPLMTPVKAFQPGQVGNKSVNFVHVHRNVMDTLLSVLLYERTTKKSDVVINAFEAEFSWAPNQLWVNLFLESQTEWLEDFLCDFMQFESKLWAVNSFFLNYDHMVADFVGTLRKLFAFLKLDVSSSELRELQELFSVEMIQQITQDSQAASNSGFVRFARSGVGNIYFDEATKAKIQKIKHKFK